MSKRIGWRGLAFCGLAGLGGWPSASPIVAHAMEPNPVAAHLVGRGCDVWVDPTGIPHIKGADDHVTLACLGYVHGRDRAWQMDFLRRTGQGRKAEILGMDAIRGDVLMRLLALPAEAERIFAEMPADDQARLWAYTYGVNRGLPHAQDEANRSYEFRKWGYTPDPWRPQDTVLLLLLQSFDQTRKTFEQDLSDAKEPVPGAGRRPPLPWDTSVLKPGEYETSSLPADEETASVDRGDRSEGGGAFGAPTIGVGSNNWVLGPTRTQSQHAWLANDPHLALKQPSFWYWAHLQTEGSDSNDVMGATLPGLPTVIAGANRKVAWGLTNSYMDVADARVIAGAQLGTLTSERPVIWFKWGIFKLPFFFKSLEHTAQGWPVLPLDLPSGASADARWVMRWSGFDLRGQDVAGFTRLMNVKSVAQADELLATVGIPSWNYVFADTGGQIGYRVVGKVPRRTPHSAMDPEPTQVSASFSALTDWEYLSRDEMPHALNPSRGYVVTANNAQWGADAKYVSGHAYSSSFRAFRIEELLRQTPKHDFESQRRIQCDEEAMDARFLLSRMLEAITVPPHAQAPPAAEGQEAVGILRGWNRQVTVDCRACGIFRAWVQEWLARTEKLGLGIQDEPELYRTLTALRGDAHFTDRAAVRALLAPALAIAVQKLKAAGHGAFPTWGEIHRIGFAHFSGDENFKKDLIPSPGDTYTVSPGTMSWNRDTAQGVQTSGASQRILVELTDPPQIYAQVAGAQGDEEKPNLADPDGPWMRWAQCRIERRTFPLDWTKVTASRLNL